MPPQLPPRNERSQGHPRIILYHQTHFPKVCLPSGEEREEFVSLLPLLENRAVTHIIIAAIHLHDEAGVIKLNDHDYFDPKNKILWEEVFVAQEHGVKVLAMLGGAAGGSFAKLDGGAESFYAYYGPLRAMIAEYQLDGLDLDIEEPMSLFNTVRLINQLKQDFGPEFLVTLAPVASAMLGEEDWRFSGFNYDILEMEIGGKIAWYNTQFYCNHGSMENTNDYRSIIAHGWPAEKIVAGLLTNRESGSAGWVPEEKLRNTLTTLVRDYPQFGGVMGWEYFKSVVGNEPPVTPWFWAQWIGATFSSARRSRLVDQSGAL
ncbi:MAG: hypothetical protein M1836_004190 [Candelina mexicana]|nr:MAG: hypothetical protein M1836_004190 [Candelina mexicana]